MKTRSHKDLIVWQKSMALVIAVYKLTDQYPKSELYGLTSQTRRSAISIPSNIAEGRRRGSKKDYGQFLMKLRTPLSRGAVSSFARRELIKSIHPPAILSGSILLAK